MKLFWIFFIFKCTELVAIIIERGHMDAEEKPEICFDQGPKLLL